MDTILGSQVMKWIYLFLAVSSEVFATSSLKESAGFTKLWPSVFTIVGYGIAFYFLSLTLREMSVGIAYAIWGGIGIVLISIIGYVRFGQKLDSPAILGLICITAGIIIINLFSKSISH